MQENPQGSSAGGSETPTRVGLDKKKGEELIMRLYDAYAEKKYIYQVENTSTAPQNLYKPAKLLLDKAAEHRWIFFASGSDRRQVSKNVYANHNRLYEKRPELYSPKVLDLGAEDMEAILRAENMGIPKQSAEYWVRSAKTLFEEFDGYPTEVFKRNGGTVNGVLAFKDSKKDDPLPGFGPKITSLLALFLAELGAIPFPEDAFAVDMHVQRLFQHFGALQFSESRLNEDLEKELRPFICEVRLRRGLDPIDLAHAFWLLGRSVCTRCYARPDARLLCPIWDDCGGLIDAREYFLTRTWNPTNAPRLRKGGEMVFKYPVTELVLE